MPKICPLYPHGRFKIVFNFIIDFGQKIRKYPNPLNGIIFDGEELINLAVTYDLLCAQ